MDANHSQRIVSSDRLCESVSGDEFKYGFAYRHVRGQLHIEGSTLRFDLHGGSIKQSDVFSLVEISPRFKTRVEKRGCAGFSLAMGAMFLVPAYFLGVGYVIAVLIALMLLLAASLVSSRTTVWAEFETLDGQRAFCFSDSGNDHDRFDDFVMLLVDSIDIADGT